MNFDSKEYTRMRDIAQKRMKRGVSAGIAPAVHFPTVREIKSGIVDPGQAMRALKGYLSGGSTVKAIRATGLVPVFKEFPALPPKEKLTPEEKRIRKRERDRLYRMRKRIARDTGSPAMTKKQTSYLKALNTLADKYKKAGRDLGIDLSSMTPAEASAFSAYMDYRFSQGDFTQLYVIDEFIQGFSKLRESGHKPGDIVKDFEAFLANQREINDRSSNMEGISAKDFMSLWDDFIGW